MGSLQFISVIRVFTYTFCIISQQGIASYLTYWLELVKASDLNEFNNFFTSFTAWTKQLTNDYLLLYSVNVNIRMYNFDDVQCTVIPSVAYGFVTGMNLQLC